MKKLFLIFVLAVVATLQSYGQFRSFYTEFSEKEGVEAISLEGFGLRMALLTAGNDPSIKMIRKNLKKMEMMDLADASPETRKAFARAAKAFDASKYPSITEVVVDDPAVSSVSRVFVVVNEEVVTYAAIFGLSVDKPFFFTFEGKFTLEQLEALSQFDL